MIARTGSRSYVVVVVARAQSRGDSIANERVRGRARRHRARVVRRADGATRELARERAVRAGVASEIHRARRRAMPIDDDDDD